MTDVLHVDVRFLAQLVLCSALLTCIAFVAFRRNAVTRRAYALLAGALLLALPFCLLAISGWHWTAPFEALRVLSLAGQTAVPLWLFGIWIGVALALNASALLRALSARRSLAALAPVANAAIEREAAAVAAQLGFERRYRLRSGAAACSSSIAGDTVVLPAEAPAWHPGALRAVLAHEFVHLARRDDLGLLALRLVLHWYWFAPWVGLLRGQYVRAMEQSCDDRAAECLPSAADYLDGVLCAARDEAATPTMAAAASLGGAAVERFQRFLGIRERQLDAGGVYWGLVTALSVALLCTSVEFERASEPVFTGPALRIAAPRAAPPAPRILERGIVGGERRLRESQSPIYPGRALTDGVEGRVVVEYRIAGDGRVVRPEVLASDPPGMFDSAVLRALARRQYVRAAGSALAIRSEEAGTDSRVVRQFDFRLPPSASDLSASSDPPGGTQP